MTEDALQTGPPAARLTLDRARLWRWIARIAFTGVAVGFVAGLVAGVLVMVTAEPMDGWRDLAAFAAALVMTVVGAALTALVGVVLLVLRFAPRGRRAPIAGWSAVIVVAAAVVLAAVVRVVPGASDPFGYATTVVALTVIVAVVAPVVLLLVREGERGADGEAVADTPGR